MCVAMDTTLVTFGDTEGTFQVEVVRWKLDIVATGEQAGGERKHRLAHLLAQRVVALNVALGQRIELLATLQAWIVFWLQQPPDLLHLNSVLSDNAQLVSNETSATLDAIAQAAQRARTLWVWFATRAQSIVGPPFFGATRRSMESWTSPSAASIRIPGGLSGPP